jgi:hypothetical protein
MYMKHRAAAKLIQLRQLTAEFALVINDQLSSVHRTEQMFKKRVLVLFKR